MSAAEELRKQNWSRLSAVLTVYAWKRTRRRSWELARDLSQDAILRAHEPKKGWDPATEPLIKFLSRTVIGLALNEWRRKRNTMDIVMSDDEMEAIALPGAATDVVIERRRMTEILLARLTERVARDSVGTMVLTLITEGIDTPADQVAATALPMEEIRRARRRLFEHAEKIAHELEMEEVAS